MFGAPPSRPNYLRVRASCTQASPSRVRHTCSWRSPRGARRTRQARPRAPARSLLCQRRPARRLSPRGATRPRADRPARRTRTRSAAGRARARARRAPVRQPGTRVRSYAPRKARCWRSGAHRDHRLTATWKASLDRACAHRFARGRRAEPERRQDEGAVSARHRLNKSARCGRILGRRVGYSGVWTRTTSPTRSL
jgi:hypothetical protein